MKPWDLVFGNRFDVVAGKPGLLALAKTKRVRGWHLGTSCRSNTWARDPQLRSALAKWGLPNLTEAQQSIVDLGNQLAVATADICWAVWEAGCNFSIENPEMSWLWWFPMIIMLWRMPGVIATVFKCFQAESFGAPWQMGSLFLHSSPTLHRLGEEFTEENEPAGLPLIVLQGTCMWESQTVFKTSLAQA